MLRGPLTLVLTVLALAQPAGQQPTFRSGTELVGFAATITDRRGNFITDLARDEIEVLEDGVKQTVELFARGDESESAPELHVGLLFDTSGSMGSDIGLARTAAIRFLNTLTDAKDMTLVDFDTEVRIARYEQANFPRMVERIRNRKPDGYTALYDALGAYLTTATDEGRKILVVFTDGGDTRSTTSFSKLVTMLRASDATVYTIGFLDHQAGSSRSDQRLRLSQIAGEAAGEAFFPHDMKEIEAAYAKILSQIRAQYTVGYVSTNRGTDGKWRKVEIRVTRPGVTTTRIQARKGYFAPVAAR